MVGWYYLNNNNSFMNSFTYRILAFTAIVILMNDVSWARQGSSMGRVILDKNHSLESQITRANTVYVINDSFTLKKDIIIPEGAVLLFEGGSINGSSKITFQNTEIKGTYKAFNNSLILSGTLKGNADLFYFDIRLDDKSYDNGAVINKIVEICKNISIPAGNIYFTTPIVMPSMTRVECDANLFYNGKAKNISAITIKQSDGIFNFNGIIRNESHSSSYPVYTARNNSKIRGLEISSVNNSYVSFKNITYFNEGLRISDIEHTGCSYNTFMLGVIVNANYHIRVYQHNKNNVPSKSAISWCNQNLFIGGRCTNFSNDWDYSASTPCYCYYFKGGGDEGYNDSQNSINNITIIGTSLEVPNDANIYIKNGSNFSIINTRHENSRIALKLVGRSGNIRFSPGYGNTKVDLTENGQQGLAMTIALYHYELTDSYKEINVSRHKFITIDSPVQGRFFVKYLEDTNGVITDEGRKNYPVIMDTYFHSKEKALITSGDVYTRSFIVPENVVKIGIRASIPNMSGGVIIVGD